MNKDLTNLVEGSMKNDIKIISNEDGIKKGVETFFSNPVFEQWWITREEYEEIRKDTDDRIEVLEKEIAELREFNEEDEESTAIDYAKTINYLKSCLAELVEVKDDEDLADDVIRAFVRKIVVFPDHFEWYLRLSPDDTPESICIDGKRKNSTKISSFGLSQHRLQ